jgi:hypothetical protein
MNNEPIRSQRSLPLRFTIRSLLILTTLVAAFFGGRASMMPLVEAERQRAEAARQEVREHALQYKAILPNNLPTSQSIRVIRQGPQWPSIESDAIDRAEQQNLRKWRQRIEKAVNPADL